VTTFVYPLCAAVALFALIYRTRKALLDRTPGNLALCGIFLFVTLGWALVTPWVWTPIANTFGIASLGGLLAQASVIAIIACNTVVLLHFGYDRKEAWRRVSPRLVLVAAVLIAMVVLFNANLTDDRESFAVSRAMSSPIYLTVYITAFTVGQFDVRRLGRRAIRAAPTMWVRRAFRVVIAATMLQTIYIVGRIADILAPPLFGVSGAAWEPVIVASLGIGSILYTIGWFLPDVGPPLNAARVRLRGAKIERELDQLHTALVSAVPHVARRFDEVDSSGKVTRGFPLRRTKDATSAAEFRVWRHIVENRDAQRALSAWMTNEATAIAERVAESARMSPETRAATIEAAQLRAAIRAQRNGAPGAAIDSDTRFAEPADQYEEILFQVKLAYAYFHSPLVDRAVREIFVAKPAL